MIQRLQQIRKNEEGFTLIELLIVIIVLGILAAIVVFAVGSTKDDAVQAACKTDVKSVELSAEASNTHEGSYPVGAFDATDQTATNLVLAAAGNGALLKTFPSSNDYQLTYNGAVGGGSYTVTVADGSGGAVPGNSCSGL